MSQSDNLDEPERPKNLMTYHSKLVGVTFEGRQAVIAVLSGKEPLRVRRELDNKFDPKAVAVDVLFGEDWTPIGFIAADKNTAIANALDAGESVYIANGGITGGGKKSFGVNIKLEYMKVDKKHKAVAKTDEPVKIVNHEFTIEETLKAVLLSMVGNDIDIHVTAKKKNTVKYTSRLIGKSTDVQVNNGHVGLKGYLSGSAFPKKFYAEFNEKEMLQKMADKFGVDKDHIKAMWGLNRDASTGYGTAIHAALENYDVYYKLGDKLKTVKVLKTKTNVGPNKAFSRNPFLKKIVEDFHTLFGGDYVRLNEQFVWHHGKELCGAIDRVKVIDAEKKIVRIQDFKTDGNIHEKTYQLSDSPFYELTQGNAPTMGKELLDLHWLQLSFYAHILMLYGYTVEGLDVYWLNPEKLVKGENAWEEFSHQVIDISKAL